MILVLVVADNRLGDTMRRTIRIEIDKCNDCPHFMEFIVRCGRTRRNLIVDWDDRMVHIPDWCPFVEQQTTIEISPDGPRNIELE